jgi:hypothetical protein
MGITMATKLPIFLLFTFLETKNRSSIGHCKEAQPWFTFPATAFVDFLMGK